MNAIIIYIFSVFLTLIAMAILILIVVLIKNAWNYEEPLEIIDAKPSLPAFPIAPAWTQTDVLALRHFLTTNETGAKLVARGRAVVSQKAIEAGSDVMHTTHSAAQAHGMNEMLNWVVSLASDEMHRELSQPTGVKVENSTAPQEDEASLVAKLSS